MGTRREFACPRCGYRATVSGGDDAGFFVATRTVVCARCREVADVVSSETPWDPASEAPFCALRCPDCDGTVRPWRDRACPRCGGRMDPDPAGVAIHWD
jgi:ssDNA-binding Zn-finger/Zn-ribbon topoisomerase 1